MIISDFVGRFHISERVDCRFPNQDRIQFLFPIAERTPAFLFVVFAHPGWHYISIDLEYPFVRVEIIAILRADLNTAELHFVWIKSVILISCNSNQVFMRIDPEFPGDVYLLVNYTRECVTHLYLSSEF